MSATKTPAAKIEFLTYAVVPDRRGWLCYVTDSRGERTATIHRTKKAAISWGEALTTATYTEVE